MDALKLFLRLTLTLVSVCTSTLAMAASYDPSIHWKTSASEHFIYHYDENLRPFVERLIPKAEKAHQRLSPWLQWQPEEKTHVVVTDHVDTTNGFAQVHPQNRIVLYAAPPNDAFGLEDFDDWLEMLFVHEYTHILHLDMAGGLPSHMRWILGRYFLLFPNAFIPRWMIEGIATYAETDYANKTGRGTSSYYRAIMRMEMQRGFQAAGDASQITEQWPSLTRWYSYGVYWYEFIISRYGEDKLIELLQTQSSFPMPYLPDAAVWLTYDKLLLSLWDEFEVFLTEKFSAEQQGLDKNHWQDGKNISGKSLFDVRPVFINDDEILYIRADGEKPRTLVRQNIHSGKRHSIGEVYSLEFDYHPQQGVLISQNEVINNTRLHHDLYRIDINNGQQTRLTRNGRYILASWSPDGKQIAAIRLDAGQHELHILDDRGEKINQIETGANAYFNSVDWSPDGQRLLFSLWREDTLWHLEEFTLSNHQWRQRSNNSDIEMHASYDEQGNIIYAADYGGVYNIYRMNKTSVQRLTRVKGAAYYPAIRNQQLAYSGLTTEGFHIFHAAIDDSEVTKQQPTAIPLHPRPAQVNARIDNEDDYFALKYLRPRWWLPIYTLGTQRDAVGFLTRGNDLLEWHNFALQYFHDLNDRLNWGSLYYQYDRWQPTLGLSVSRLPYLDKYDQLAELSISLPWIKMRQQWTGFAAYQLRQSYQRSTHTRDSILSHLAGVGLSFNNYRRPVYTPDLNNGFFSRLKLEGINDAKANQPRYTAILHFNAYSPTWKRNILKLETINASGNDTASPYLLFGTNANPVLSDSVLGQRNFRLRGYNAAKRDNRQGNSMQYAALSWTFPVSDTEFGFVFPPAGLIDTQGRLFVETGRAWDIHHQQENPLQTLSDLLTRTTALSHSIGAEIELDLSVLFAGTCKVTVGIARGLSEFGEDQAYSSLLCN